MLSLFLCLLGVPAIDVGEIVAKHEAALGGLQHIHSLNSFTRVGWYREGTFYLDNTHIFQRRPFYRVIEETANKNPLKGIHEGFDGSAWEYYDDPGIVVRTVGPAAAAGRHGAMFDDPLVEPSLHGTTLTLTGEKDFRGKHVYVVHCVLNDGSAQDLYVDSGTFMIDAQSRIAPMHAFGKQYNNLNVLEDYRPEGGFIVSHKQTEIDADTGNVLTESGLKYMIVNPDLPLRMFSPPTWKKTPLQEMIDRIYDQRDEAAAALSTYYLYRPLLEYKSKEVGDAVDFAGYQCLKMGHADTAVALLTVNVADHPGSARAQFGLARALQTAGDKAGALEHYRAALAIDSGYDRAKKAIADLGG